MESQNKQEPGYKNPRWFTLVELLFWVTLSAILMTGIILFVSSSLGSNMTTKKILEEGNKNRSFEQRLGEVLGNISLNGVYATGASFGGEYLTGVFLSTLGPNLPITFLGLRTQTGYCDSYLGTASETGTLLHLAIRQFSVPDITQDTASNYILFSSGHSVFSGTTRILGTGYPGNAFDTTSWTLTELSSPSALILSGSHLYIADTMNDRVLSYDTTLGTISRLLGPENGIRKPTSLFFSGSTLLIASSGNGKIYSLQDGEGEGDMFSSTFRVANNFSADTLKFTFSGISSVTSPVSPASFILVGDWVSQDSSNDTVVIGASLDYTFTGGLQDFSTGSTYEFIVNNLSPPPITPANYTVRIDFLSGSELRYSDTFHFFTKGDGSLESGTGNTLTVLSGGLIYPHAISGSTTWSGTVDWTTVLGQSPLGEEMLSSLPVRDLYLEEAQKVLTIRYTEYIHYDCLLGKHLTAEKVRKVFLP